jgi:hypothetical protein
MGVDAWKVNSKVKIILSRNWVDVPRLLVNTVKDTVCIKGDLSFTGGKVDGHNELAVSSQLRKVEREVLALPDIRHVDWRITGWQKKKNRWERKGFKPLASEEEKKE